MPCKALVQRTGTMNFQRSQRCHLAEVMCNRQHLKWVENNEQDSDKDSLQNLVLVNTLLNWFNQNPLHPDIWWPSTSDWVIRYCPPLPPGDVWSPGPIFYQILVRSVYPDPLYPWCFLLAIFHPLTSARLFSYQFPPAHAVFIHSWAQLVPQYKIPLPWFLHLSWGSWMKSALPPLTSII